MRVVRQTRWRTPVGCFSELISDDGLLELVSVEQPWNDNIPFKSCVPVGTYRVIRDYRPSHKQCFCMINEDLGVSRYPAPGMRDSCLFHIANFPTDVEGCQGPGLSWHPTHWGVSSSAKAMERMDEWLGDDDEFELVITWHNNAED